MSDDEELVFRIVRAGVKDEILARAMNVRIARGAYEAAVREYPNDCIELLQRSRIIERSRK